MRKRMALAKAAVWLMRGWNAIDLASQLLLLVLLGMRLSGQHLAHADFYVSAAAFCAVLLWSKLLYFLMPFATTGAAPAAWTHALTACHPDDQRLHCD